MRIRGGGDTRVNVLTKGHKRLINAVKIDLNLIDVHFIRNLVYYIFIFRALKSI
jgi:hypothetical protein